MASAIAAWRRLSFGRRLTIAGAAAVAVAVALAAGVTYVVVRAELRGQLDNELRATADRITQRFTIPLPGDDVLDPLPDAAPLAAPSSDVLRQRLVIRAPPLGGPSGYAQIVTAAGRVVRPPGNEVGLRPDAAARRIARAGSGSAFSDAVVDSTHVRVLTAGLDTGGALQLARPAEEVDAALARLAWILALVALGGVGLAVALGLAVTRAVLRPVTELTEAAEHVARTRDLSRRIDAGDDELGRLGAAFNTMLGELEGSMRAQRQLVADASHELRTPLTSLRTNLEVLAAGGAAGDRDALGPGGGEDRAALLRDVVGQIEELSALVGDLVELARDEERPEQAEALRLDELVAGAVERARRRHPERVFVAELEYSIVEGVPARIDRAVANLLDNAQKWSPPGRPVEVSVSGGRVVVRDHGPGIAAEDMPRVFDRFYRAPSARSAPGSGLGLAIVRAVGESHGGCVEAADAEGGGAVLTLALQPAPALSRDS